MMTVRARIRVTCAISFAAAALGWLAAVPAAHAPTEMGQTVPRAGSFVCMGTDGTLSAPINDRCGFGQSPVPLDSANAEGCSSDPWMPKDPPPDDSGPPGELTDLEMRIKALEDGPLFEVLDQSGRPILQVLPCELRMSNEDRWNLALLAVERGGHVTARSNYNDEVSLGVSGDVGGVLINDFGRNRVEFGKQPQGNYSLRFPGVDGLFAAVGQSRADTGALIVGDEAGRARALMSLIDGKGRVMTQNADGNAVTALIEGESEAGMFVIGDKDSEPVVKFSVTQNRYGAVLAGPLSGLPTVPGSGMPGSYILGCAGGASCGPGGGGQQR
jgi:hypothetical protein